MKTLELIDKRKNAYGDVIYYIRDEGGATVVISEKEVEGYLRKKGASSLTQGHSYVYRK